jgi:hypothetical protein
MILTMKTKPLILLLTALSLVTFLFLKLHAADLNSVQKTEFIILRWQGRDNSKVVRSNGKIENLNVLFNRVAKPDGIDERAYYMNIAMNAFAKEGYDFAGMANNDEIVMKRKYEQSQN